MQKRGQITIFIVVGILILFAVGLVLYVASIRPELRIFAERESEVEQYIGVCLETTAEEAITQIGATGGYLNVPQEIAINDRAYFSFVPRTEPKIPLWYYRGELRIPTRDFIAGQISQHILNIITPCFRDFDVFKDRYNVQLKGNATVEATIAATNVFVKLNYPLELQDKRTGEITKLDFVGRTVDVKLGRMYDMAVDILQSESKQLFFENLTFDLLGSSYEQFPLTSMEFSCTPKIWKKTDIIAYAKGMVARNIRRVSVEGNPFQLFEAGDVYAQNHFVFPLSKRYSDIGTTFLYSDTARFELHVRPNDREILRSNRGQSDSPLLNFLCINTWHFTYDIEYPLLTTLRDASAFKGQGFIFNFAFPVTINSNKGDKTDFPPAIFEAPLPSYDFCEDVRDTPVDIRVKDEFSFEEIYKADVAFKCVRFRCELGNTTADGGSYRLRAKLPAGCTGGLFIANKEGYLDGESVYFDTDFVEIFMKPLRTFRMNIVKHDSDDFSRAEQLGKDNIAIIMLRTPDGKYERTYTSESEIAELELIDGDAQYQIDALLLEKGTDQDRIIGGYLGLWNTTYPELLDKSTITFHLTQKIPIAVTEEEQIATADYLFGDKTYQEPLRPAFS